LQAKPFKNAAGALFDMLPPNRAVREDVFEPVDSLYFQEKLQGWQRAAGGCRPVRKGITKKEKFYSKVGEKVKPESPFCGILRPHVAVAGKASPSHRVPLLDKPAMSRQYFFNGPISPLESNVAHTGFFSFVLSREFHETA
jgi:hypothetical protein